MEITRVKNSSNTKGEEEGERTCPNRYKVLL